MHAFYILYIPKLITIELSYNRMPYTDERIVAV